MTIVWPGCLLHVELIILLLISMCGICESKCVHDEISDLHSLTEDTGSLVEFDHFRVRRGTDSENDIDRKQYEPLRVYIHDSMEKALSPDVMEKLKNAAVKAVDKISSVLSVIPVQGPLLLPRLQACGSTFIRGINKGRCSRLQNGYKGEMCLDLFKIPYFHLEGLKVYNATPPEPVFEIRAGPGVNNTDVIVYITSLQSQLCSAHNNSVTAFASHCQVDKAGRPISGLVNICPFTVLKSPLTPQFLYATFLHEILHVLGFSTKLFNTFKNCNANECKTFTDPMRSYSGQWRFITPAVVNNSRIHFSCFDQNDFSVFLQTEDSKVTSHWNSYMMYTSVMTPSNKKDLQVLLDPITLAVMEDSGWYKVNYTNADTFLWGKGQGCSFGLDENCEEKSSFFCSGNSKGCHFMKRNKGVCDAESMRERCGIYTPQDSCAGVVSGSALRSDKYETFSSESRCFLSTISTEPKRQQTEFEGRCYIRKCLNGTVFVKLPEKNWVLCHAGQNVQVAGLEGEIQCPGNVEIMCMELYNNDVKEQITQYYGVKSHLDTTMKPLTSHSQTAQYNRGWSLQVSINIKCLCMFLLALFF